MSQIEFYIVLRRVGANQFSIPSEPFKHWSGTKAKDEALRLARIAPAETFVVFKSIGEAVSPDPARWIEHDEIPF